MSHHYMRQTITDTTDLTPLARVDGKRTSKRAEQISHLHQQFEDLKQKIKEVQNKNQKIIEKIHKAYNFKKKNAYTEQYMGQTSPVIHYQNKFYGGYTGNMMSIDAKSNKSDQGQQYIKIHKRISEAPRKVLKNQKFNHSLEYGKNEVATEEGYNLKNQKQSYNKSVHQMSSPPLAIQTSQSSYSVKNLQRKVISLDEALSVEKTKVHELDQELTEKENELARLRNLQNKLKNYSKSIKNTIQVSLEQFMESVVQKNFIELEKGIRKNDVKLKNMKSLAMVLKDKQQEKKSTKLIEYGRRRRSKSKSRRNSPPNQQRDPSKSRSKINQQNQKNKEFQEIANRYEELIKVKAEQIQKWDRRYKIKERECHELKMRADILQRKLMDEDKKSSKNDSMSNSQCELPPTMKKFSAETNLLGDDEEDFNLNLQMKIKEKDSMNRQLSEKIITLENKIKMIHSEYKNTIEKTKEKAIQDFQLKIKEYEGNLSEKNNEIVSLRGKLSQIEKKIMERECDTFGVQNKVKKLQLIIESKDKKIIQLQGLLTNGQQHNTGQILEKSVCIEGSSNSVDMKSMKQYLDRMEDELEDKKNEVFALTKNKTYYMGKVKQLQEHNITLMKQLEQTQIQNEQLKINVNINNISSLSGQEDIENDILDLNEDKLNNNEKIMEIQQQKKDVQQKYQALKNTFMKKQSQYIKETGQLEYIKKALVSVEEKYEKMKEDHDFFRDQAQQYKRKLQESEKQLQFERKENQEKINEIQQQWIEFEEEMKANGNGGSGVKQGSDLRSQKSSVFNYKNRYDHLATQNQYLTVKLKEVQTQLKMQKNMQQKILNEYKTNTQKTKLQFKSKVDENHILKDEVEMLRKKVANLNLRISADDNKKKQGKSQQNNQLLQKIQSLQQQLAQTKQINNRLTDMQGQLFKEMKLNEEEKVQLLQELQSKRIKIKEMQELLQMKDSGNNPHKSHISSSSVKRESIKSQSSLKYSSNSQMLMSNSHFHNRRNNEERIIDLQLSQAGSSFYEQPSSQFLNISEIFEREQVPYEKMKIKRKQQMKLLEKTSSYIKSLKAAIDQKGKKIKLLQKKIQSLKTSELVRKDLGYQYKEQTNSYDNDFDDFKDYESVQLDRRRGGQHRKYKQLEDDTKLVMQENHILTQQIQGLQQQLLKAEQQQNSLVKIKDLYKEEIKKLIKKNEEQTKSFEEELRNERLRVEESESVHNIQAMKQLFLKIIQVCSLKFTDDHMGSKKKEEKRKQLEEYVKILSNILKLDKKTKESLLGMMHK